MEIQEPHAAHRPTSPLWRLAFRAGFLAAGIFGVLGMSRWTLWMLAPQQWRSSLPPHWWHAHEMIFGFAMPVVAGFLLTAVATWTGLPGTRGLRLQLVFGCWLLARLLLWLSPALLWVAWALETLFLLLVMYELGRRVWARRQHRNLVFPPLLLALAVMNAASYARVEDPNFTTRLHYAAVWMICVFVVIVGGRVIPLFTGNRLGLRIVPHGPGFDFLAVLSVVVAGLLSLFPWQRQPLTAAVATGLYLAAGAIQLYRMLRWQGWKTGSVPLLWSMHLSYLCIPLTLFGLAWAGNDPVVGKNLIHLLAVGTVGGMILTMMSRVSLGHTGRSLEVPFYMALAFALVFAAALLRALLPVINVELTPWAWRTSALLWIVAFSCFVGRYTPILLSPRADGRDG